MRFILAAVLFVFVGITALTPALAADLTPFASVTPTSVQLTGLPGQRLSISFTVTNISQDPTLCIKKNGAEYTFRATDPPLAFVNDSELQEIGFGQSRTFTLFTFDVPYVQTGTSFLYSNVHIGACITRWNKFWSVSEAYVRGYWIPYYDGMYITDLNSSDIRITVVPEPSSVIALLCGVGGTGGVIWGRKLAQKLRLL